jgi:CheY-like chemotaxis protein
MTKRGGLELVDVLLVEDDPGDVLMTREAFEHYRIPNSLYVVGDGEQAMHFLRKTGEYAEMPTPGLILLDLDSELLAIPVVVLTTSQAEEDILRSYSLHANAYISKPVDFEKFVGVIGQIDDFFLTLVKLPSALS